MKTALDELFSFAEDELDGCSADTWNVFVNKVYDAISAAEVKAIADEREQCAQIADAEFQGWGGDPENDKAVVAMRIAAAIRRWGLP
jgi:hypothetical protein